MSVESSPEQQEIPVNMTNALNERFRGTILEETFAKYPNWVTDHNKFCKEASDILNELAVKNKMTKSQLDSVVIKPIKISEMKETTFAYLYIMYVWNILKVIEQHIEECNTYKLVQKKDEPEPSHLRQSNFRNKVVDTLVKQHD